MTVPLNEMFEVVYGNKFDLNKMQRLSKVEGGVNFVGRSSRRHGITGTIARVCGVEPFEANSITVALGGTMLLTSYVQMDKFYTAQNVAVLTPSVELSLAELVYICIAIRHNRFRYSAFGREANRTLRTLLVPSKSEFPKWLSGVDMNVMEADYRSAARPKKENLNVSSWEEFALRELFDIKKGKRLTKAQSTKGRTAFISAIDFNNGLRERVEAVPRHPKNVITVNYNGNGVAEAFYQPEEFFASDDVNVLYPKFEMDEYIAVFICTIVRREKYRYSYGRKWNLERMLDSIIKLPAYSGQPDFASMRTFIMSLPFSGALGVIRAEEEA